MAGLLGGDYTPDPIAMGLLGMGSALMTPRQLGGGVAPAMQAFSQQAMLAQEMRRRMAADAERAAALRERTEMERKRFGMDEQKFGLEMEQFQSAQARAKQQEQFVNDFITTASMKDPEIAALARVDMKAAIERAYPKPEWRTWFDQHGRQTQGFVAPGQAPTQVGGAQRNVQMVNTGGSIVPVEPLMQDRPLPVTMSPSERDASARGWAADARARERLAFDRTQADRPQQDKWVNDLQRGIQVNERTGESRPITQDGKPIGTRDDDAPKRQRNANDALAIIREAEGLLDKATAGYIGTGVDKALQAFGGATKGAVATGQLQTLQAALMMRMPRMEGPQSNLDVALYRESVGQIGDSFLPIATRKAALATVKRLQEQYAGVEPSNTVDFKNVGGATRGGVINFGDLK